MAISSNPYTTPSKFRRLELSSFGQCSIRIVFLLIFNLTPFNGNHEASLSGVGRLAFCVGARKFFSFPLLSYGFAFLFFFFFLSSHFDRVACIWMDIAVQADQGLIRQLYPVLGEELL